MLTLAVPPPSLVPLFPLFLLSHPSRPDRTGLPQFPRRLSVADLKPNMSNASVYGQVVSVRVPEGPLPAVLSTRSGLARVNQESLTQLHSKPVLLLQPPGLSSSALEVVELGIRDARGQARVLCCGRKAASDALRCR